MGFQAITYFVQAGVATISLDRPEARNALSDE
jgi:enoyl-CoA hydratase/carnithine racemase